MKTSLSGSSNMRRSSSSLKLVIAFLFGVVFGLFIEYQSRSSIALCKLKNIEKEQGAVKKRTVVDSISNNSEVINPLHVKPKASHFNYDFRPYFVYSELGFRSQLVVAVQTNEANLKSFVLAINNTWLQELPKVVFFTPYSRKNDFHEKYNMQMKLDVVQLPDVIENDSTSVEFSFRILRYMKDHYINNYYWFMHVPDNIYINSNNLIEYLQSMNSSKNEYNGYPRTNEASTLNKKKFLYCDEMTGTILSRTLLQQLEFVAPKIQTNFGIALGAQIHNKLGVSCTDSGNNHILKGGITTLSSKNFQQSITIGSISSPDQMIQIHKTITMLRLKENFAKADGLKENVRNLHDKLPEGVPEKNFHWPVGVSPPFKPASRFEVIPWTYFTKQNLFGHTDLEPVSTYDSALKRDLNDVMSIVQGDNGKAEILNGYHRVDPQRGSEYIIDVEIEKQQAKRVHLLRPLSKIEALPMPAATEQKGIHLVLPVLRDDVAKYELFLQMYKRVCLQTGENVILLTVFVNVRGGKFEGDEKNDYFKPAKDLIARYKHSYMWAQLPWLQVGVKYPASVLLMDIVSMKLPPNSLIFWVDLNTEFTTNFLNRCRVNVVSGMQVFFPISFVEYDPNIVYTDKQKPTFVEVHRDNGFWDHRSESLSCYNNNDYKQLRMRKDDFLDENISENKRIIDVFKMSKLQIFRAVDSELRQRFVNNDCIKRNQTDYFTHCRASRSQLAQYLFKIDQQKSNVVSEKS